MHIRFRAGLSESCVLLLLLPSSAGRSAIRVDCSARCARSARIALWKPDPGLIARTTRSKHQNPTLPAERQLGLDESFQVEVRRRLGSAKEDEELTVAGRTLKPARDRRHAVPAVFAGRLDHS